MNLTALQAAIQAKGYTTDTASLQIQFINEVYREICGIQRWPFLEAQDTSISTVAGTTGYSVAGIANLREIDAVRIEVTALQQYDTLNYMDPQEFRDMEHIDRDQSTPFFWTFINQTLRFYPVPDQVYTVTIDYVLAPADLAVGSDVPLLPSVYHDVLVWGAIESLAFRERDWLGRQFAQGKKEEMLKHMAEEFAVRQRQTASHVKKSGYWNTQLPYPFSTSGF